MQVEIGKLAETAPDTYYVHCKWCDKEVSFGVKRGESAKEFLEASKSRLSMPGKSMKKKVLVVPNMRQRLRVAGEDDCDHPGCTARSPTWPNS